MTYVSLRAWQLFRRCKYSLNESDIPRRLHWNVTHRLISADTLCREVKPNGKSTATRRKQSWISRPLYRIAVAVRLRRMVSSTGQTLPEIQFLGELWLLCLTSFFVLVIPSHVRDRLFIDVVLDGNLRLIRTHSAAVSQISVFEKRTRFHWTTDGQIFVWQPVAADIGRISVRFPDI